MSPRVMLSFSLLLAGLLAVSAVAPPPPATRCDELDSKADLLEQMRVCQGLEIKYKNGDPFELTGLDQATVDELFYWTETVNGIEVPNFEDPKQFKGSVTIRDSTMERLTLFILATGLRQTAKIMNNPRLKKFTLQTNRKDLPKIDLTVKGNKQLSLPSIYRLHKVQGVTSSSIQEYQECFFDSKPIMSISELDGCTSVEGDLVIGSQTNTANMSSTLRIAEIRNGCLRIENSNLTSLEFLKELLAGKPPLSCADSSQNPSIKGNTKLCLTSEDQLQWKEFQLSYAGTCEDRCTVRFAAANPQAPCTIVTGDVKITGAVDPKQLHHWDRVTKLEGTLEVDDTDLTEIVIFKNLTTIVNPSRVKRALTVIRNSKLERFDLPSLVSIKQPPDSWQAPLLFHQNNDNYKLSLVEYKRWQRITDLRNPSMPKVDPPTRPTTTPPPMPSTQSQEEILRQNEINEEANKKTEYQGQLFLGLVVGLLAILCIGTGIASYCICGCEACTCRKRKREEHDAIVKKPGDREMQQRSKAERGPVEREELTIDSKEPNYELSTEEGRILEGLDVSYQLRESAKLYEKALQAVEMPFKMSDMITNSKAEELDFNRASKSEEKSSPSCYRYIEEYRMLAYNPTHINRQPTERMENFDPYAVLKVLLTNCNEFFVTNARLMPDTINYLSGPYYGGKSKNLLAKIDGPVTCITDIHSMLDTLQVILNINFNETNDNKPKVHPAFCQKYVILGDLVDRGDFGLECSVLVCLLARLFPGNFIVLRGNHDQRMVLLEHNEYEKSEKNTINVWGHALKEKYGNNSTYMPNPHHFADSMYWEYLRRVAAYMPYACLINGKIFACHGGMSGRMLKMTGTLDELFGEIPIPYLEDYYIKRDGCSRYYAFIGNIDSENEEIKKKIIKEKERRLKYIAKYFESTVRDESTLKMNNIKGEFFSIENDLRIRAKHNALENDEKKQKFPILYPFLYELVWSDPGTVLASHGNPRNAGNIYSYEDVTEFCEKFGLEYIVRGHQKKFSVSPDGKVVNIYSNPYHLVDATFSSGEQSVNPGHFASILRINADGTRTFVFIWMSREKERDQALAGMITRLRNQMGEKTKNMGDERLKLQENGTKTGKTSLEKVETEKKVEGSKEKSGTKSAEESPVKSKEKEEEKKPNDNFNKKE